MEKGVYVTKLKNGTPSYRVSINFKSRHIALGSYSDYDEAANAYKEASLCVHSDISIDDYSTLKSLRYDKFIVLLNFRDNNVYIKNPIYLKRNFFYYHLSQNEILTFDIDDLFYYSNHRIQKRGGRYFCADFGMQITLKSRYGIKNYAVENRDYFFKNGDNLDYRYENIYIINKYHGLRYDEKSKLHNVYIHINGDYLVGKYKEETVAAICYNKAADCLKSHNILQYKNFPQNYIDNLSAKEYAEIYSSIDLSDFLKKISNL